MCTSGHFLFSPAGFLRVHFARKRQRDTIAFAFFGEMRSRLSDAEQAAIRTAVNGVWPSVLWADDTERKLGMFFFNATIPWTQFERDIVRGYRPLVEANGRIADADAVKSLTELAECLRKLCRQWQASNVDAERALQQTQALGMLDLIRQLTVIKASRTLSSETGAAQRQG